MPNSLAAGLSKYISVWSSSVLLWIFISFQQPTPNDLCVDLEAFLLLYCRSDT